MHVLIIPKSFPTEGHSPTGLFFRDQAFALISEGNKVGVVSPDLRSLRGTRPGIVVKNWFTKDSYTLVDGNGFVYRQIAYNLIPFFSFWNEIIFKRLTNNLFDEYLRAQGKPDVIHSHNSLWAGVAAAQLAKKHNIKHVVTEHSSSMLRGGLSAREKRKVSAVHRLSHATIAVSSALAKVMYRDFGTNARIIANMVDLNRFRYQAKNNPNHILSVGNLIPVKGFDILIKAFAEALKENPDLELTIVGVGFMNSSLAELIIDLRLQDSVRLVGWQDPVDVAKLMSESGVFVSPSRFETFGIVLIEAAASGCVLVATDSGGPRDIVDAQNGIICEVGNVEKLSSAIKNVRHNYDKYVPQKISEEIQKKYGTETIAKEIMNVYED